MIGVDVELPFKALRLAVLTVSDTRTATEDKSGDTLAARIVAAGHALSARDIVKDNIGDIRTVIKVWAQAPNIDAIITTGGTGLTGRDVTVEAIRPLFEKELNGFAILFHRFSFESVGLATLQSRACAGIIDGTFVFCLPGSTGAVRQAWDDIIRDMLDSRYRPSSLVDLIPRLSE